jgi:hypothetical protein
MMKHLSRRWLDLDQCAPFRLTVNSTAMTSHNLKRDIVVILAIKISIVLMAAFFVFGPRQRPQIDINALQHQILNNSDR